MKNKDRKLNNTVSSERIYLPFNFGNLKTSHPLKFIIVKFFKADLPQKFI